MALLAVARIQSAQPQYPHATLVDVEVDVSRGLHSFTIVGLPDKAVEEAKDRVSSAIKNSGFSSPKSTNNRIVVSLAPADLKKEGPLYDVPIALAYLVGIGALAPLPGDILFMGELALDGSVRPVRGVLSAVMSARNAGYRAVFVPAHNAKEAGLIKDIVVYPVTALKSIIEHFTNSAPIAPYVNDKKEETIQNPVVDFREVRGQESAKRALEIAAAGRHNVVLFGPPGTGKSLLAKAFCGILPPLTFEESLEATVIHSLAGTLSETLVQRPPIRTPHHTSSHIALVGGGSNLRPGEVTLAHRGVLFLDEFPEFERQTIDALREPLEERSITISRAKGTVRYPANFILVAAMNPSRGHNQDDSIQERLRYQKKISGPIVDRVDMWIEVGHISHDALSSLPQGESSSEVGARVASSRVIQYERFGGETRTNADMSLREMDSLLCMKKEAVTLLNISAQKLDLSPRSYHRTSKLARTIADLEGKNEIEEHHILEALQYRPKDLF